MRLRLRARLLLPADQPDYGALSEMSDLRRVMLASRFHTPVWHGKPPGGFVCRVCPEGDEGDRTPWPCSPALHLGVDLFVRQRRGPAFSRPNYDKRHRCPGWSGGGWTSGETNQCDGGYIMVDYESRWWPWKFHRCNRCTVRVLPDVVRWVDPSWLAWWIGYRVLRDLVQWWENR